MFYSLLLLLTLISVCLVEATPMTASLPLHQPISPLKRTLVLIDEPSLKNSSSKYFDALASSGHKLKFKKFSEGSTVVVRINGEFEYDNVVVFLSTKQSPTDRSLTNLLDFVDSGGNVLLATSGLSKWARDFAFEAGIKMSDSPVLDRFAPSTGSILAVPWPQGREVILGQSPQSPTYIKYAGVSCEPTAEATTLGAVKTLAATTTSYQPKSAISGTKITLITSVEMRNNARVTVSGSVEQFGDNNFASNALFNERLSKWTFAEASVLLVKSWHHRRVDGSEPELQSKHPSMSKEKHLPRSHFPDPEWGPNAKIYRIRDEVEYRMSLEVLSFDGKWQPYVADDVQLEFAMLDPYQRRTLVSDKNGNYYTRFMLPDQYGTFAFRVVYNRPGLSHLRVLDSVNVRPFRHDEYERFIASAFPYYSAVGVVMLGFLVFSIAFASVKKPHVKTE